MVVETILDLELCVEDSDIDSYFENSHPSMTLSERTKFLQDYMGMIGVSYYGELTEEEKYSTTKDTFIDGRWRFLSGRVMR